PAHGPDQRRGGLGGCAVQFVRRRAGRRQGQHQGQFRRDAAGAGISQEADGGESAGGLRLGRRRQQPLDHLGEGFRHYEPAELVAASFGYDLPSFKSMYDLPTWKNVEPPLGTVYSYPPRGDEQTSITGRPARPEVGAQIYNQAINTVMVAKFTQGNEKLDDVIKWAENELEGTL